MGFVKWMDNNPKWLKIVLAIPFLDIIWVVYRLVKSMTDKNVLGIVLAIILLVVGIPFLWIVDIVTLILMDKVLWI